MNTPISNNDFIRETIGLLFANKDLIIKIFAVFAVLALIAPLVQTKKFMVTGEIIILAKKLHQGGGHGEYIASGSTAKSIPVSLTDMETESNILRSLSLQKTAVEELIDQGIIILEPGLIERLTPSFLEPDDEALIKKKLVEDFTFYIFNDIEIAPIPGSNIISIIYEGEAPELGRDVVARLMQLYLKKRRELVLAQAPEDFFGNKKELFKQRLRELENKRLDLFNRNSVSDPESELALTLDNINDEENELNQLRDTRLENQQWLTYLGEQLNTLKAADITQSTFPFSFGGGGSISDETYIDSEMKEESRQIAELHTEYANAKLSFKADSIKITKLVRRIKLQKERLVTLIDNRITERGHGIKVLDTLIQSKLDRIETFNQRAELLKRVASEDADIDTELNAVNDAYFKYSQFYEEKRSEQFAQLDELTNVKILSLPAVPLEPSSLNPLIVMIIILITGGMSAVTLVFLQEFFDSRFKFKSQLEQELGLPVIAVFDDTDSNHALLVTENVS